MELYDVFTRKGWKDNPSYPNGLEPHLGKKTYLAKALSYTDAKKLCEVWNATHKPGRYHRMAEFQKRG